MGRAEGRSGAFRGWRPRTTFGACIYVLSLVLLPTLIAWVTIFTARVVGFCEVGNTSQTSYRLLRDFTSRPCTPVDAILENLKVFSHMVSNNSAAGHAMLLWNWIGSFGAFSAIALLLLNRWNPARIYAFLCAGTLVPLGFVVPEQWRLGWEVVLAKGWANFWIDYPPYALVLGLLVGWLISKAPSFQPERNYWLVRGYCPMCRYNLRGNTDAGCPECGWNRSDEGDGRARNTNDT